MSSISGTWTDDDTTRVLRLIELLDRSGLGHLQVEADGLLISISKGDLQPSAQPAESSAVGKRGNVEPGPSVAVTAPHVGVYRAPAGNGAQPLGVGSKIDATSIVGSIEAIDQAHVVPAGVVGTIADVCVGNGDFVEFGQPLFRIELKRDAAD